LAFTRVKLGSEGFGLEEIRPLNVQNMPANLFWQITRVSLKRSPGMSTVLPDSQELIDFARRSNHHGAPLH